MYSTYYDGLKIDVHENNQERNFIRTSHTCALLLKIFGKTRLVISNKNYMFHLN